MMKAVKAKIHWVTDDKVWGAIDKPFSRQVQEQVIDLVWEQVSDQVWVLVHSHNLSQINDQFAKLKGQKNE